MNILLYAEKNLGVDLKAISDNLNSFCKHLRFTTDSTTFEIMSRQISFPSSYESLPSAIVKKTENVDYTFFFSSKQYYNNYFFETYQNMVIVSFFGWQQLTPLSKNNGVVYFIADLIALEIDNSVRHDDETGCIYDFGWNKTGIDLEMRNAFICPPCLARISKKKLLKHKRGLFADLQEILDILGKTSKWNKDIVTYWKSLVGTHKDSLAKKKPNIKMKESDISDGHDVFLAHNSADKPIEEKINSKLKERGLSPWLDKERIPPGRWFQDVIQDTIGKISSAAIIIGTKGLGRWQVVELRSFISQCVERNIPVIPVLLPGVERLPRELVFLNEFNWVKFKSSADEDDALDNLVWGITGKHPKSST
jgi:hypothetical protein